MSGKKDSLDSPFLDQNKLVRTIRVLIKATEELPDDPLRDAIWGGLEAALEEAQKPIKSDSDKIH